MSIFLEAARIAGHIVHKAIILHRSGADKPVIDAVIKAVEALKEAHRIIHHHWSKLPTEVEELNEGKK